MILLADRPEIEEGVIWQVIDARDVKQLRHGRVGADKGVVVALAVAAVQQQWSTMMRRTAAVGLRWLAPVATGGVVRGGVVCGGVVPVC